MTRSTLALLAVVAGGTLFGLACDDQKSASDTPRPDAGAGTDKYATADPKLAKALQAAASASAAGDNGPPPEGIFPPGAADRRHAKGLPTKVDLIGDGSEPRISLSPSADASADSARASAYGPARMQLGTQMGPRVALPTVDFGMVLGSAKPDDGGADWLVGDVKRAAPAREQLGQLPPGVEKEMAVLAGSQIKVKLTADGRASDLQVQPGKAAHSELELLLRNAAEALVLATVPLPPKAVGVGAQWIAETRMPLSGLDVIAYRAYRVKGIDGDRLRLTLQVQAYSASQDVQGLQGLPKGATLEQFDAEGQGELDLVRGECLARKSDVQQKVVMVFQGPGGAPPSQPGQPQSGMLTAQIATQSALLRGDDLKAAAKQP